MQERRNGTVGAFAREYWRDFRYSQPISVERQFTASDDVRQRPLELAAQTASLHQDSVRPVAKREGLVTARAFLIAKLYFPVFLRTRLHLRGGHRDFLCKDSAQIIACAISS
jgi:hypothetical protein